MRQRFLIKASLAFAGASTNGNASWERLQGGEHKLDRIICRPAIKTRNDRILSDQRFHQSNQIPAAHFIRNQGAALFWVVSWTNERRGCGTPAVFSYG